MSLTFTQEDFLVKGDYGGRILEGVYGGRIVEGIYGGYIAEGVMVVVQWRVFMVDV